MSTREDVEKRRASLSDVKQALLEKRRQGIAMTEERPKIIPLLPQNVPAPASFAQQRFWFIQQLGPDTTFYNDMRTFRISGNLNAQILRDALQEVMRRYEILRTNFVLIDGQVQQVLHPYEQVASELVLLELDLQHTPASLQEQETQHTLDAIVKRPFDLANGLLWRPLLIKMSEADTMFVCVIHHILCDGWGLDIFERELQTLYMAFQAGQPSPLPEPELQYADFAYWEQQLFRGDLWQKHLTYWGQVLADAPKQFLLYGDHPRQFIQNVQKVSVPFMVPAEVTKKLRALSSHEGVTVFMTLLATFQLLLFRYSGQEDIIVGTPVSNRSIRPEFEQLIGCFINMVALRTNFAGNPTFQKLLQRVRTTAVGAYAHQEAPFEKLVADLAPVRDKNRNPFFQIIFDFQNYQATSPTSSEPISETMNIAVDVSRFDLIIGLWDSGTALSGGLFYNSDLFDASTIECIRDHFLLLLTSVTEDVMQPISELPALTEMELQKIATWDLAQETDRTAQLALDQHTIEEEETEPRTPLEELLVSIWSQVLDVEWVGIHENFFKIGGHSLLATQLLVQIQDVLNIEIPLQLVFDAPTIAEFVEALLADEDNRKHIEKVIELLLSVADLAENDVEAILEAEN